MIDITDLSLDLDSCVNYFEFSNEKLGELDSRTESYLRETSKKMSSLSNGVGRTAARRYLLSYELGKAPEEISDLEGVSTKTIKNQTGRVKNRVLDSPDLAKAAAHFRSSRAELTNPELPAEFKLSDTIEISRGELTVEVSYSDGAPDTFYTWCYCGETTWSEGDCEYTLKIDFKINEPLGVLLKQTRRGVKKSEWNRPPAYSEHVDYDVYPLPHERFPSGPNGSHFEGIANHLLWDVKNIPFTDAKYQNEGTVEPVGAGTGHWLPGSVATNEIRNQAQTPQVSAADTYSNIQHLINLGADESVIEEFTKIKIKLRLYEKILGTYPLNYPTEVPDETRLSMIDKSIIGGTIYSSFPHVSVKSHIGSYRLTGDEQHIKHHEVSENF